MQNKTKQSTRQNMVCSDSGWRVLQGERFQNKPGELCSPGLWSLGELPLFTALYLQKKEVVKSCCQQKPNLFDMMKGLAGDAHFLLKGFVVKDSKWKEPSGFHKELGGRGDCAAPGEGAALSRASGLTCSESKERGGAGITALSSLRKGHWPEGKGCVCRPQQ